MLSVHYLIIIIIDFIEEETEADGEVSGAAMFCVHVLEAKFSKSKAEVCSEPLVILVIGT